MTIWIRKDFSKNQRINKSISLRFLPQHWRLLQWKNNGARKERKEDTCYDLNIYFLGIFFSYTNWNY